LLTIALRYARQKADSKKISKETAKTTTPPPQRQRQLATTILIDSLASRHLLSTAKILQFSIQQVAWAKRNFKQRFHAVCKLLWYDFLVQIWFALQHCDLVGLSKASKEINLKIEFWRLRILYVTQGIIISVYLSHSDFVVQPRSISWWISLAWFVIDVSQPWFMVGLGHHRLSRSRLICYWLSRSLWVPGEATQKSLSPTWVYISSILAWSSPASSVRWGLLIWFNPALSCVQLNSCGRKTQT